MELSTSAQMELVFASNPPDVIIYMSCPNRDLSDYRSGLVLESIKHKWLTQNLYNNKKLAQSNNRTYAVKWYDSLRNKIMAELRLEDYENYSLPVVEDIVKQFDPTFVITVDGRRPVQETWNTVQAKLMTMSLHRGVVPKIIEPERVVSVDNISMNQIQASEFGEEFDTESYIIETATTSYHSINEENKKVDDKISDERSEKIRCLSEFGRLCPVNFFNGSMKLGIDRYCMKFMGKLYFFAGPDEMTLFGECPRRFLENPKPGLPVKALFHGPEMLSNPTAKAVCKFFGYDLIDVKQIRNTYAEKEKRAHLSSIVNAVLKNASKVSKIRNEQSKDITFLRNAIRNWLQLYFGITPKENSLDAEGDIIEYEINENYSDQSKY